MIKRNLVFFFLKSTAQLIDRSFLRDPPSIFHLERQDILELSISMVEPAEVEAVTKYNVKLKRQSPSRPEDDDKLDYLSVMYLAREKEIYKKASVKRLALFESTVSKLSCFERHLSKGTHFYLFHPFCFLITSRNAKMHVTSHQRTDENYYTHSFFFWLYNRSHENLIY